MSKEASAKLECMNSNEVLFRSIQKLVKRGKLIDTAVVLTSKNIEVYRYDDDKEAVIVAGVFTYTQDGWKAISDLLDGIAFEKKQKWTAEFVKLCGSDADEEEWALDLSLTDCAILTVGNRTNCKEYKIPWNRRGILSVMDYLVDSCTPRLDA